MKDNFLYLLEKIKSSHKELDLEKYINSLEELNNFLNANSHLEKIEFLENYFCGLCIADIKYSFESYEENYTSYYIPFFNETVSLLESLKKYDFLGRALFRRYSNIPNLSNIDNEIIRITTEIYKGEKFSVKENKFFIDNRPIKRGKLLKYLGLNSVQIDMVLSDLDSLYALERGDFSYSNNITEVYSRGIKTCMFKKDMSVLEEIDVQVCTLNSEDTMLARTLIYSNLYKSGSIYSSSNYLDDIGISNLEELPENYRTQWIKGHPIKRFIPYMDDLPYVIYNEKRNAFCFAKGDRYKKLANYLASSTEGFVIPNIDYLEKYLSTLDDINSDFVYRGEITKDEILELGYCSDGVEEWLEKHNLPDEFYLSDLVKSFIHHDTSISQKRVRMCRDIIEIKIKENLWRTK